MKTHTNAIGPAEKKFCPKCGLLHERDCTNTNDTALIEAMWNEFVKSVEEMPDDGTIEVLDGTGDYFSYAGGKSSAGICQAKVAKRMLSRLQEAEKERDFAREGCKKALTCASLDSSVRAFIRQVLDDKEK